MKTQEINKEEAKTINAEQLKKLKDFNAFMDKARLSLGELSIQYEFQKSRYLKPDCRSAAKLQRTGKSH